MNQTLKVSRNLLLSFHVEIEETRLFFLFSETLAGIFYFEMQRSRNSLWEDPVCKFLRSKVVFNFKISSSLLGHYFSTLVLWFSSMCVQILDLIRQPWGLGILLRAEFRAHNGVKFLLKKRSIFYFMHQRFHEIFPIMLQKYEKISSIHMVSQKRTARGSNFLGTP